MTLQIAWGLVEVGRCSQCRTTEILWTHSFAKKFAEMNTLYWGAMPLVVCAGCHQRNARYALRHPEDNALVYDYPTGQRFLIRALELIKDTAPLQIEESQYPYLTTLNKCGICQGYIAENSEVDGVRADNLEPIILHAECSITLRCCNRTYPTLVNSRSVSPDNWDITASTTSLGGLVRCRICLDEYLEERDESLDDYFSCNSCDSLYHMDNVCYFNGENYCERCIDNNVYRCSDCDTEYWDGEEHDCSDSYGGLIHDYSYKPSPYFFGRSPGERIFMGFELEVEVRDGGMREHAERVKTSLGEHAYLKYDGSLDHGFEIVTHPHSLDSYRKEFDFESFRKFRNSGLRSWDTSTCGLHIHVSRSAFGSAYDNHTSRAELIAGRQLHELRFIKLIYDNQRQVTRLAGRTSTYANFADKGNLHNKVMRGYDDGGRYSAVNTQNENTLEVRLFKGSLNEKRVLMALEFVHSAVEYTRDLKVNANNKALSWLAFSGYIHEKREQYPNLHALMIHTLERDEPTDSEEM